MVLDSCLVELVAHRYQEAIGAIMPRPEQGMCLCYEVGILLFQLIAKLQPFLTAAREHQEMIRPFRRAEPDLFEMCPAQDWRIDKRFQRNGLVVDAGAMR